MTVGDPLWLEGDGHVPGDPDATSLSVAYSAREDRRIITATLAEGVISGGEVTGGSGTTVDVSAFLAVVEGDDDAGQGHYLVYSDDTENVAIGAAPGSNSRIDVVYVQVRDDTESSGGFNDAVVGVVAGTPAADPSVPAIPDTAIALAEVLVTAGDTSSGDYTITDVRVLAVPATIGQTVISDLADVDETAPEVGESLVWDGSKWAPGQRTLTGTTVVDDTGGVSVAFGVTFASAPVVVATALTLRRTVLVNSVTTTGFSVAVTDEDGLGATGSVSWIAVGA